MDVHRTTASPPEGPAAAPPARVSLGTFRCTDGARRRVNAVLDSGRLTYGPFSREFEERFAAIHGADFAVLSSSGTSALQMALAAMKELHGWADGDEVIVPAVTFVATANIVLHCRMTPVFADVDPRHYDLEPEAFARAITPRTRAVIPVHLFGQPWSSFIAAACAAPSATSAASRPTSPT
jgi:perosamine synthetase